MGRIRPAYGVMFVNLALFFELCEYPKVIYLPYLYFKVEEISDYRCSYSQIVTYRVFDRIN